MVLRVSPYPTLAYAIHKRYSLTTSKPVEKRFLVTRYLDKLSKFDKPMADTP